MPAVIALLSIIGYFGLLFFKISIPDTINVLIVSVISFYFGSHVNGVQTAALTAMASRSAFRSTDVPTTNTNVSNGVTDTVSSTTEKTTTSHV